MHVSILRSRYVAFHSGKKSITDKTDRKLSPIFHQAKATMAPQIHATQDRQEPNDRHVPVCLGYNFKIDFCIKFKVSQDSGFKIKKRSSPNVYINKYGRRKMALKQINSIVIYSNSV